MPDLKEKTVMITGAAGNLGVRQPTLSILRVPTLSW